MRAWLVQPLSCFRRVLLTPLARHYAIHPRKEACLISRATPASIKLPSDQLTAHLTGNLSEISELRAQKLYSSQMDAKPLLRNLLRQASILYDDVARRYITRYIKQRFRLNRTAGSWRRTKLFKEGRRGLSVLIRANAGDPKPLTKVLEMSYGRSGRRKHELLEPVINQPLEIEPEPLIPNDPRSAPPATSAALRALLASQSGRTISTRITPKLPETDAWGRPLPLRRKVNMLHEHHSSLLGKVLPPLSSYQMGKLERLARGLEAPVPPKRKALTALPLPKGTDVHNVTPRFMRRMWKRILAQCSSLNFDDEKKRWSVTYSPFTEEPQVPVGRLEDFEGMAEEEQNVQRQGGERPAKDNKPEGTGECSSR